MSEEKETNKAKDNSTDGATVVIAILLALACIYYLGGSSTEEIKEQQKQEQEKTKEEWDKKTQTLSQIYTSKRKVFSTENEAEEAKYKYIETRYIGQECTINANLVDGSHPLYTEAYEKTIETAQGKYQEVHKRSKNSNYSLNMSEHLGLIEARQGIEALQMGEDENFDAIVINPKKMKIFWDTGYNYDIGKSCVTYEILLEVPCYRLPNKPQISTNPALSPLAQIEPPTLELKSELGFTLGLRISEEGLHFYGEKDKVKKHLEKFKAGMIALQAYTKSAGAFDFESMTNAHEAILGAAGFEDVFPYRGGLLDPDTQSILFE